MKTAKAFAVLKPDAGRWLELFPGLVPIVSGEAHLAELASEKAPPSVQRVYVLDAAACDPELLVQVAEYLIEQCGGGTAGDVLAALACGVPLPLRASLVRMVIVPISDPVRQAAGLVGKSTWKGGAQDYAQN